MERYYWTHPEVYHTEVEVEVIGDGKVVVEPVIFHPDEGGQPPDGGRIGQSEVLGVDVEGGQVVIRLDKPIEPG